MSLICEVVEDIAYVSSELFTTLICVALNAGSALATPTTGWALTASETVEAVSTAVTGGYALTIEAGSATSDAVFSTTFYALTGETAVARDSTYVRINEFIGESAVAQSDAFASIPLVAASEALAVSDVYGPLQSFTLCADHGRGTSTMFAGSYAVLESIGEAVGFATPRTIALATEDGLATGDAYGSMRLVQTGDETGLTASEVFVSAVLWTLAEDTSVGASDAVYRDPARTAWVMNAETTAMALYTNYDFTSVAQTLDKTLAVGPSGLYEITGDMDQAAAISARIVGGYTDLGAMQTKRIDAMYLGYIGSGLQLTVEVQESGAAAQTYFLEARPAPVPRPSRIFPGKGLYGRYWRFTVQNTAGSAFTVYDTAIDVAVSTRRL